LSHDLSKRERERDSKNFIHTFYLSLTALISIESNHHLGVVIYSYIVAVIIRLFWKYSNESIAVCKKEQEKVRV